MALVNKSDVKDVVKYGVAFALAAVVFTPLVTNLVTRAKAAI